MRAIALAVLAAAVLLAPAAASSAQPSGIPTAADDIASAQPAAAGPRTDLNSATMDDLTAVPGIGERLAQSILDLRAKKGSFSSVEDLLEIRGIGEKSLKNMAAYLTVSHGKPAAGGPPPVAKGK